jgi:hypothetical protein
LDRRHGILAAGQGECPLRDHGRVLRQAGLDARVRNALSLRCLFGDDCWNLQQRGEARQPGDSLDGVGSRRPLRFAHCGVIDESRLCVHNGKNAVNAPNKGHPRDLITALRTRRWRAVAHRRRSGLQGIG